MMNAEVKQYCERLVRLEEQRKALAADITEIKKEAEGKGFDKKLITKTVALMLKDETKRAKELEQHELFDTYLIAVGMLPSDDETPANSGGLAAGPEPLKSIVPAAQTNPEPLTPVSAPIASGAALPPVDPDAPIPHYGEAVKLARSGASITIALLKSVFNIDYTEAATLVERLEAYGVISAPQHTGKRHALNDAGEIPSFLRRKPKPEYTATELLASG